MSEKSHPGKPPPGDESSSNSILLKKYLASRSRLTVPDGLLWLSFLLHIILAEHTKRFALRLLSQHFALPLLSSLL